ncbi:MAG TPA: glycosyltransferase family 2 protein [Gaiellales bacterium]|nr:glycosyltransferase family 2 protein [Gaiellales bacterium]
MSSVVATVVSHDQRALLGDCLAALARDGVPALVCENVPDGSAELARSLGFRAYANERPRTFAQNQNALFGATGEPYVLSLNPDVRLEPGCAAALVAHAEAHPSCGVAGPRLLESGGELQRSRRRFPTVGGTLVRRTPLRALLRDVEAAQPGHYLGDVPDAPVECDWMLGACLLLRRRMLEEVGGFDESFPMYGEDIELQYRAARAGWERWYVPSAVATHDYQRVVDRTFLSRRTWWHLRGMVRYVRKHPETLARL